MYTLSTDKVKAYCVCTMCNKPVRSVGIEELADFGFPLCEECCELSEVKYVEIEE